MRSKSIDFFINYNKKPPELRMFKWNGFPLYYRTATSDVDLINVILFRSRSEYHIDTKGISPKIILDIGGNIGLSAIYFAIKFPNANIYSLEPQRDNFELLLKNTAHYKNIKAFNIGLGNRDAVLPIYNDNDTNNGTFSLYTGNKERGYVQIRNAATFFQENITDVDLIKIDTEGAEYDILTSIPQKILQKTSWIIGELHNNRDKELIDYLSEWFKVTTSAPIPCPACDFLAINHNL